MADYSIKNQMGVGIILDKSINFIVRNITWITLLGFIISLPEFLFKHAFKDLPSHFLTPYIFKFVHFLATSLITPLLAGMITLMLSGQMCGKNIPATEACKKSFKKILPMIGLGFMISIAMLLGFICLIIPGFIVLAATACAVPAMMLENLKPMKAFDRSWELTKGNRLRLLGYFAINFVVISIFGMVQGNFDIYITHNIYLELFFQLITGPCNALWPALATLLFYDLRIRKEALDLEVESNTIAVEAEVLS